MIDKPDHMESISHDPGLREVLANQGTVDAGQIHADDTHLVFAFEFLQIVLQGSLAAAKHHVELVTAKIAIRGGVTLPAGEEVFVNAEHPGTNRGAALGASALEKILEPRSTVAIPIP